MDLDRSDQALFFFFCTVPFAIILFGVHMLEHPTFGETLRMVLTFFGSAVVVGVLVGALAVGAYLNIVRILEAHKLRKATRESLLHQRCLDLETENTVLKARLRGDSPHRRDP